MFEGFKFWDKMLTKNMESHHPHDWKQLILPSRIDRWMEEDVKRFSRTTEQVVVVLVLGKQPAKPLVYDQIAMTTPRYATLCYE